MRKRASATVAMAAIGIGCLVGTASKTDASTTSSSSDGWSSSDGRTGGAATAAATYGESAPHPSTERPRSSGRASAGQIGRQDLVSPDDWASSDGKSGTPTTSKTAISGSTDAFIPVGAVATTDESHGRFGPKAILGTDERMRVKSTLTFPNVAIVYIEFTNADGNRSRCTGFMYAINMVATAGHCVYGKDVHGNAAWFTDYSVQPARDGATKPFGTCGFTTVYSACD